ncbi:MAG: 4Fe-4S binding protein [Thermoplasmata archaeon]|nr:MAG: 4Fe-4S binding protein [Thermoplasmata archaeon]
MENSAKKEAEPKEIQEDESEKAKAPAAITSLGLLLLVTGIVWLVGSLIAIYGLVTGSDEVIAIFKDDVYMVALYGFTGFFALALMSVFAGIFLFKLRNDALSMAIGASLMGIGIGLVALTLSDLLLVGIISVVAYTILIFFLFLAPVMRRSFSTIHLRHFRTAAQFSLLFIINATIIGSLIVAPFLPILRFRHMAGGRFGVPLCSIGSLARCLSGNWWGLFIPIAVVGVLILIGILIGRAMCGWVCPIGFLQDMVTKARVKLHLSPKEPSQKNHERLTVAKYAILFLLLLVALSIGISAIGHTEAGDLYRSQYSELPLIESGATPCEACPAPIIGYFFPDDFLVHSLDGSFVMTTEAGLRLFVLGVFIAGAIFMGRFFCRYLCPSGAMISFFNKGSMLSLYKDQGKCTKCNYCVTACPMRIQDLKDEDVDYEIRDRECIYCLDCIDACPEKALILKFQNKEIYKGGKEWWEKVS